MTNTHHETAIVMAGAWDILGQPFVIGSDVRELVIIAKSIMHDAISRITWEVPSLPVRAHISTASGPQWRRREGRSTAYADKAKMTDAMSSEA